jgi:hypothetical protein
VTGGGELRICSSKLPDAGGELNSSITLLSPVKAGCVTSRALSVASSETSSVGCDAAETLRECCLVERRLRGLAEVASADLAERSFRPGLLGGTMEGDLERIELLRVRVTVWPSVFFPALARVAGSGALAGGGFR